MEVIVEAVARPLMDFFSVVSGEVAGKLAPLKKEVAQTARQVEIVSRDARLALDRADDLKDVVDGLGNKVSKVSGTATSALSTASAAGATAAAAAASAAALAAQVATIAATVASAAMVFTLANELRRAINNARAELDRAVQYLYAQMEVNQKNSLKRDNDLSRRLQELARKQGSQQGELDMLRDQIQWVKSRTEALRTTVLGISTEVGTLVVANRKIQSQVANLTQALTATQTQVATITQTLTGVKIQVATITQTLTATKTQVVIIQQQLVLLRANTVQIVKVPVIVRIPVPQIIKVPVPVVPRTITVPVTNTNTITNNNTRIIEKVVPLTNTNTITKTEVKIVPVTNTITNTITQTNLSSQDLTKIKEQARAGACSALSTCNPDSQRIKRIDDKLGEPFATPTTLLNISPNPTIQHETFASLFSWWIKQMDALIGEFPIKLEIEDSDLMQVGDQTLHLNFPNLAEAIAELMGLSINSKSVTEANLDATMRTLMESGSGRKQAIVNHSLLEAIQSYLGFTSIQKMKTVDFTFDPVAGVKTDKISEALVESKQQIKVEQNIDPDTLEKQLKALIESARIIKAVHTRNLSPENVEEWKEMIRASRDQVSETPPDSSEDDFDKFLRNVEQGWTTLTGHDPSTPYDRNIEERPKTRRLKPEESPDA